MNRSLISVLFCLVQIACVSPFQKGRIERDSKIINGDLPTTQKARMNNHIQAKTLNIPSKIAEWNLIGSETKKIINANPGRTHVIYGYSLIAKYQKSDNSYAVARMYINPIWLGYGDLGNGGYGFGDSHSPARYIWNQKGEFLLQEEHYPLTIDFKVNELGMPSDLSVLREYQFVIGHIGAKWKRESIKQSSVYVEQDHFELPITASTWRDRILGEYWIVAAPTKADAQIIALSLLERQRPNFAFD